MHGESMNKILLSIAMLGIGWFGHQLFAEVKKKTA